MKYGNLNEPVPDVSQEVEVLKDLLQKEEITREQYNRELVKLQQYRMMHIVATNGGYTLGKKSFKRISESINAAKKKQQAVKQQSDRAQFLEEVSKTQPTELENPE